MFIVRNYVVIGRKNSGSSPRLCPPPRSDCLSWGLKSVDPLPTQEDVLLGQSLSSDSWTMMTHLNSTLFPIMRTYGVILPLAQESLTRDPQTGYFGWECGGGRSPYANCFVYVLNTFVLGGKVHTFSSKDDKNRKIKNHCLITDHLLPWDAGLSFSSSSSISSPSLAGISKIPLCLVWLCWKELCLHYQSFQRAKERSLSPAQHWHR